MLRYFVDAWFYIALIDRRDSHHAQAVRLAGTLAPQQLVTHDAVFTEFLAYFAEEGARIRRHAVESIRRAIRVSQVVPADRELFLAGLDRYAARPDEEWSHVDCMSMVVMEDRGIRHVLTNDHHFSQAGFTVVNE
ncbi:MAG TPA: PIN domain-containing protein [Thermoanaerobaculia bacterium]|nr:PIN domain-containing protein [Thermoanaerobaculia bacterium]